MLLDVSLVRRVSLTVAIIDHRQLNHPRGPTGELQVDQTGITASNASVPLPQFRNAPMFYKAETEMFSHLCFLAQVSLRSIVDRIVDSQKGYREQRVSPYVINADH